VQGRRIVVEQSLNVEGEGRQHDDASDTLLVEDRHPRVAMLVLGANRLHLSNESPRVRIRLAAASEVVGERARLGDRVEGGILDHLEEVIADDQLAATVVGGCPAERVGELRLQVTSERVGHLVVVLVRVVQG
jgi:hypothetical protein